MNFIQQEDLKSLNWLDGENVRPYVFVREDNRVKNPGMRFDSDWFPFKPIRFDPLKMDHVDFSNHILNMEHRAFETSEMPMPRWVFYDCALMPGFVAGFAHKTSTLPDFIKKALEVESRLEWTPISLFVVIPTMATNEWMAHNLCSVNALVDREKRYYGLGFLTKAFGLWYANINICCGVTQWTSPAIKLHSHYGEMEVLTAYTPVHDYSQTLTYRLKVDPGYWGRFFTGVPNKGFEQRYQRVEFEVDPKMKSSLIELQNRIELGEGPFYLRPSDVRSQSLGQVLPIYTKYQGD